MIFKSKIKSNVLIGILLLLGIIGFTSCSSEESRETSSVQKEERNEEKKPRDTPTKGVENFFVDIEKNVDEIADDVFRSTGVGIHLSRLELTENEDILNVLKDGMKKVKCEVLSEEIKGDKAKVTIKVIGPDTKEMLMDILADITTKGTYNIEETKPPSKDEIKDIIKERVSEMNETERESFISVVKIDNEWEVNKSDSLLGHLLMGKW